MPKTPYTPTVTDSLTGQNVRALRQRRGETLKQTVDRSGFGKDASTLAATERGERLLTDLEATKLAAHFNTTTDTIRARPDTVPLAFNMARGWEPATEQDWLGNTPKPASSDHWLGEGNTPEMQAASDAWLRTPATLFAVPDKADETTTLPFSAERSLIINLDQPLTPDAYREQVWIPYLEARYAAETA